MPRFVGSEKVGADSALLPLFRTGPRVIASTSKLPDSISPTDSDKLACAAPPSAKRGIMLETALALAMSLSRNGPCVELRLSIATPQPAFAWIKLPDELTFTPPRTRNTI